MVLVEGHLDPGLSTPRFNHELSNPRLFKPKAKSSWLKLWIIIIVACQLLGVSHHNTALQGSLRWEASFKYAGWRCYHIHFTHPRFEQSTTNSYRRKSRHLITWLLLILLCKYNNTSLQAYNQPLMACLLITGGPPLVRSPLVRILLVQFFVLYV